MKLPFYLVDVFAENKLEGNQLAVFDNAGELSTVQMQAIAKETNLAETTFITQKNNDTYRVRIFTTEYEMPFAGHPTVGTAAVIANKIQNEKPKTIHLELNIGPVDVHIEDNKSAFTLNKGEISQTLDKNQLAQGLELDAAVFGEHPIQVSSTGFAFAMVHVADMHTLKQLDISPQLMKKYLIENKLHKSVATNAVTLGFFFYTLSAENPENQMHARMLLLQDNTIFEDPATGSAHTAFIYYALKNNIFGTDFSVRSEQGFEIGRPSILEIKGSWLDGLPQITLGGKTQFVAQGIWEL